MKIFHWKTFFILLVFAAALIFPMKLVAADSSASSLSETVFDNADLLTSGEEEYFRTYAKSFEKYQISVIFLTTSDAEGKSSMHYSNDFYDTHAFGPNGVMFLIDMDNRNIYIDTVGKCIDLLSENDIDHALDISYTHASSGDYFTCFEKMSKSICTELENHLNPFLGAVRFSIVTLALSLFIATVTVIILIVRHNHANKKTEAEHYIGSNFKVHHRNAVYMGCRREVLTGYYDKKNNSSSGGSHISSRGVSHGGGGRSF